MNESKLRFETRLEHRAEGAGGQLGSPVTRAVTVTFRQVEPGEYRGQFNAPGPGAIRTPVNRKTNGKPFLETWAGGPAFIKRVVARFQSLRANAVDPDGNGTLDYLEITARLRVIAPCDYSMQAGVSGSGGQRTSWEVDGTLSVGEGALTIPIPASDIRRNLGDGLWTVSDLRIHRPVNNTFGDFVETGNVTVTTAPYRRADFDRGKFRGDERASVRGIRPGPAGKFRFAEVQWQVFTPGGSASWKPYPAGIPIRCFPHPPCGD